MDKESKFPSIVGLLGVAFVILKLCNVIDWSWWLVTLPFWGGLALFLISFVVLLSLKKLIELVCKKIIK